MKQLKITLTPEQHKAFKLWCLHRDTDMVAVMRTLIERVIAEGDTTLTPTEAAQRALDKYTLIVAEVETNEELRQELIAWVLENKDNEDWPKHMRGDVVMQWVNMTTKSERYGNKVETYPIPKEIEDAIQDEEEDADADGSDTGGNGSDR